MTAKDVTTPCGWNKSITTSSGNAWKFHRMFIEVLRQLRIQNLNKLPVAFPLASWYGMATN